MFRNNTKFVVFSLVLVLIILNTGISACAISDKDTSFKPSSPKMSFISIPQYVSGIQTELTNSNLDLISSINMGKGKPGSFAINTKSNTIYAISLTPLTAGISSYSQNMITVLEGSSNKLIDKITIGDPKKDFLNNMAIDPNNGMIYATGEYRVIQKGSLFEYDSLYMINPKSSDYQRISLYSETEEGKEGDVAGIAINPKTSKIYVGSLYPEGGNPALYVVDGKSLKTIKVLDNWQYGIKDIIIDPLSNLIYAGGKYDDMVSVIDGKNDMIIRNITVSAPIAMTADYENAILYVLSSDGVVTGINMKTYDEVSHIGGMNVRDIVFSPSDVLLYAVDVNVTNIFSTNKTQNDFVSRVISLNGLTHDIISTYRSQTWFEKIDINQLTKMIYLFGRDGSNTRMIALKN